MASAKFTDRHIAGLKPTGKVTRYMEPGSGGFGVEVTPKGQKKFFYRYKIDGTQRFLSLGIYKCGKTGAGITLAEANQLFTEAKSKKLKGIDPLIEKETAKEERKFTPFVADFVQSYITDYATKNNSRVRNIELALNKDFVPRFGKRKLTDIKTREMLLMFQEVANGTTDAAGNYIRKPAPVGANRLQAYVSKLLSLAVKMQLLPINPLLGMDKAGGPETAKNRALSPDEIVKLWLCLETLPVNDVYKRVWKLVLITGQRGGEICQMHRNQIDGDWWTIPASAVKNKRDFRVYLSTLAKSLISGDGWIFPQSGNPDKHITSDVLANELGAVMELIPVDKFTTHDLRRTFSTRIAADLKVPEYLNDVVMNHVVGGKMHKVYNVYDYSEEKQDILTRWGAHLNNLLAPHILQQRRKGVKRVDGNSAIDKALSKMQKEKRGKVK